MRNLLAISALAAGALLPPINLAEARTYGPGDVALIAETSKSNEMRFNRDYKGQNFVGTLPLARISEDPFVKGNFRVEFGAGGFGNNVDCKVQDQRTVDVMIDWNKGQSVTVSGVIADTLMGDIQLSDCKYSVGGKPAS
jgi:hypothetical protein